MENERTELSKLTEQFGELTFEKIKLETMLREINIKWNKLGEQIEKLKERKDEQNKLEQS